jgi:hypothetical protein
VHRTADPLQSRTVICTVGMHRSGTSLVSRTLNLLGVYLGAPECISNAGDDNPRGYWEHHPLALLNDEVLAQFGGRWDDPPVLPEGWPHDPRLGDLRARARHLLVEHFATEPLWGWKDPRTCLTLPFWQDLIGPMRYVVCLRNPCAVVASLGRRNGLSSERAERLWLTHVCSSLAHTSGQPRLFVFYEDMVDDAAPELRRLAAFIGGPERSDDPQVPGRVAAFIDPDLCHHRMSIEELAGDRRISFATKSLYLALRGHAPADQPAESAVGRACAAEGVRRARADHVANRTLEHLAQHAVQTFDAIAASGAVAAERDRLALEHHTHAAAIGALDERALALAAGVDALTEREGRAQQSAAMLATELREACTRRDGFDQIGRAQAVTIASLGAELGQLGAVRDHLESERDRLAADAAEVHELRAGERQQLQAMAGLESELRHMTAERDDRVCEAGAALLALGEIHESSAWRLVTFSRRVLVALFPAGTRRRQAVNLIVRRAARRADAALRPTGDQKNR